LFASLETSEHVLPQASWPAGQAHWPEVHVAPAGHFLPHMPQLSTFDETSTQPWFGPQYTAPMAHWHCPETHVPEGPHLVPQLPQLFGSFDTSAHAPCAGQATWPIGQAPQAPEVHAWPVRHALSQPPQFFGSVETSTQPLWQVTRPGSQTQTPAWHEAPGLHGPLWPHWQTPPAQVPSLQSVPHVPQFFASVFVSTQVAPQSVVPF
jgi:hypothetical protein